MMIVFDLAHQKLNRLDSSKKEIPRMGIKWKQNQIKQYYDTHWFRKSFSSAFKIPGGTQV